MDVNDLVKTSGLRRKATLNVSFCVKKERNASFKKVSRILQKSETERTDEEKEVLNSCSEVVKEVTSRLEKRKALKARSEEVEDSKEVLETKCEALAKAVQRARHLVVYSGAGVSTAACIPDYRGSNGIWTRLQQGLDIGQHDLSKTQPTLTHMVLFSLYKRGMLKHVVSQNCDGLHLRSGLPRAVLSEVHGNMYLEICQPCKVEYWRLFDVTEHTGRYSHATARRCYTCHKPLRDTIVHFGERGGLKWPINWSGATAAANQADVILCIGSSLKVLKKYPWLWGMDRPVKKRPNLYIVNLQWTPKDEQAALKINGKCDEVMALMMSKLSLPIPEYNPLLDPIFIHATRLHPVEAHTYSTAALEPPDGDKESNKRPGEDRTQQQPSKRLCDGSNKQVSEDKKTVEENGAQDGSQDSKAKDLKVDEPNDLKTHKEISNSSNEYCNKSDIKEEIGEVSVMRGEIKVKEEIVQVSEISGEIKKSNVKEEKVEVSESIDEIKKSCVKEEIVEASEIKKSEVKKETREVYEKINEIKKSQVKEETREAHEKTNDIKKSHVKEEIVEVRESINDIKKPDIKEEIVEGGEIKKEHSDVDELNSCKTKDESKNVSPCKSPGKGIWRPFSFDDNGSSSSSFGTNKAVESVSTILSSSAMNISTVSVLSAQIACSGNTGNSISDQNSVKKCLIQLEPLDLSCGKKSESESFKPNPYFCKYCRVHYHSGVCLFYRKQQSENPPDPPCYCCDEEDEKDPLSPDADTKSADETDKSTSKTPITNPGWFGKGYRKKIRKKR